MSIESTTVGMSEFEREVAGLVVEALRLEMRANEFPVDAPLYGGDLGLDSIDMLEIALAVSKRYGVEIASDDVDTRRIFASLRALAEHVRTHRVR
jgi:acyl carrier protein